MRRVGRGVLTVESETISGKTRWGPYRQEEPPETVVESGGWSRGHVQGVGTDVQS